jgi:hypothetical protein
MSVQLIIYPQYFDGLNPLSGPGSEFMVDAINFVSVNTSSNTTSVSGTLPQAYITPNTFYANTWYRYGPAGTSLSVTTLQLGGSGINDGILQRLSNLVPQANYEVSVDIASNAAGFTFYQFTGNTQVQSTNITGTGVQTLQFTAQSDSDTVVFQLGGVVIINSISVSQISSAPTIGNTSNGQVILDLYENEDIPLTLSVDDFKNVAEQVQSYSKAFKLPATKRNNKIFDNIFEITRTVNGQGYTFNPYVKTRCELKQDGFILFEGYLRLIDIINKQGEISYNVNLYSEVIALADTLGDRTFSDLDFTELTHPYNRTQIQNSWDISVGVTYTNASTSTFRETDTVAYPFCDWNHSAIVVNSDEMDITNLTDIFRPFLKVKYLIDRIFNQPNFPFSYTSDFFSTNEFDRLYMDFNWGSDVAPTQVDVSGGTNYGYYIYGIGDPSGDIFLGTSFDVYQLSSNIPLIGGGPPVAQYDMSTNTITGTAVGETYPFSYAYSVQNTDTSTRVVEFRILVTTTAGVQTTFDVSGPVNVGAGQYHTFSGTETIILASIGDTIKFQVKADVVNKVKQSDVAFPSAGAFLGVQVGISSITSGALLQNLRGETNQWQFLKGIMTMFNLVSIPDKDNPSNILIEPYSDVFIQDTNDPNSLTLAARGIAQDWTDKIDQEEIKLEPLTDLNAKTIFKFAEDEDQAFKSYKIASGGFLYGSKIWDATVAGSGLETLLTGEEEIIAEPFAATVIAPYMPQFSDLVVPSIYSYNADDGTSEGFDNLPRIMYRADSSTGNADSDGVQTLTNTTYNLPAYAGVSGAPMTTYLQFSHLSGIPASSNQSYDYHFGECQLLAGAGFPPMQNLFNLYWRPYMAELYNSDTRTMSVKVNLTPADIATFNLYDTVFIKNRQFRVNHIEYKPNDLAVVEFILIP